MRSFVRVNPVKGLDMNSTKQIGVFCDVSNLHKNIKYIHNGKLNYKLYLNRIGEEGEVYRAFAYGSQIKDEAKKFISALKLLGFEPKYITARKENPEYLIKNISKVFKLKSNDPIVEQLKKRVDENEDYYAIYQTDRTIDLIIDVVRIMPKLDIVVIGSSNINIIPLIEFLKERGIKVIIFSSNIPTAIKITTHQWWEVTEEYLESVEEEVVS